MNMEWRSEKSFHKVLGVCQDFHRHKREWISVEIIKETSGEETAQAKVREAIMCRVFGGVHS